MASEMLEAAIRYSRLGLSVIPLHGKRPFFDDWYDVASRDEKTLEKWWTQSPDNNIGIATGIKSNVFVVDIDPRHGGDETYDSLVMKHGQPPSTWEVVTGSGGRHIYYRMPNFAVGNHAGLWPGIDIRGTRGQVVGPPSIHPDTHQPYTWDFLRELEEEPVSDAPDWVLDALAAKVQRRPGHEPIGVKIPKGVQHHTLVSLAGRLRSMGLNEEEILPALLAVNRNRCTEPGEEDNIRAIAKSMMRYQPHERNLYAVANTVWRIAGSLEKQADIDKQEMKPIDALSLIKAPPAEPHMVVADLLHNGLTIFAGPPKAGKSWFTLQLALAVAQNGMVAGSWKVSSPGGVAYWALEESPSRTGNRIRRLTDTPDVTLQNIEFLYEAKPLLNGGLEQIERYLKHRRPNLVVIDTLLAICRGTSGPGSRRSDVMAEDYQRIAVLQKLAHACQTAIVVVHHNAKYATGGDVIQGVAGSVGTTAAADCIWGMSRRPEKQCAFEVIGREVEGGTYLMGLDLSGPIGWQVLDTGQDANTSEERNEIIETLRELGPCKPEKLVSETRKKPVTVRSMLKRMADKGQVIRFDNGNYGLPGPKVVNFKKPNLPESDDF